MNTYTCRYCGGLLLSEKLDSCGCLAAATEAQIARRPEACYPSSKTPETDANEYGATVFRHAPDTVRLVHADLAKKLECERDKALEELRIQWEENHDERCSNMKNCASFGEAKECHCPRPSSIIPPNKTD